MCPYARLPHGITRLPLKDLREIFTLGTLLKSVQEIQFLCKIGQNYLVLYVNN